MSGAPVGMYGAFWLRIVGAVLGFLSLLGDEHDGLRMLVVGVWTWLIADLVERTGRDGA